MRYRTTPIAALVVILLASCATNQPAQLTSLQHSILANQLFTQAINTLTDMREAGLIDAHSWGQIKAAAEKGNKAIAAFSQAAREGDPEWRALLQTANVAIDDVIVWQMTMEDAD